MMLKKLGFAGVLLCSGMSAVAADGVPQTALVEVPDSGIVIRSEKQFAADYAGIIEKLDTGVYLFTDGVLAGKVVTMGLAGLEYDLAMQRRALRGEAVSGRKASATARLLERLEAQKSSYLSRAETGVRVHFHTCLGNGVRFSYASVGAAIRCGDRKRSAT